MRIRNKLRNIPENFFRYSRMTANRRNKRANPRIIAMRKNFLKMIEDDDLLAEI